MDHKKKKKKALERKAVKQEYDSLEPEYHLLRAILKARTEKGLTQADIAKIMGTKTPAITRLESALSTGKHSPSISTLKKYAQALGYNLEIRLVRN